MCCKCGSGGSIDCGCKGGGCGCGSDLAHRLSNDWLQRGDDLRYRPAYQSWYYPNRNPAFDIIGGVSLINYGNGTAQGVLGNLEFVGSNNITSAHMMGYLRGNFEPMVWRLSDRFLAAFLVGVGYRFGGGLKAGEVSVMNEGGLEYGFGFRLRDKIFDVGMALDFKHEQLRASNPFSTVEDSAIRPWLRVESKFLNPDDFRFGRYFFGAGIEFPLSNPSVDSRGYYKSVSNHTGDYPLGAVLPNSPDGSKFVTAHFPQFAIDLFAGVRLGDPDLRQPWSSLISTEQWYFFNQRRAEWIRRLSRLAETEYKNILDPLWKGAVCCEGDCEADCFDDSCRRGDGVRCHPSCKGKCSKWYKCDGNCQGCCDSSNSDPCGESCNSVCCENNTFVFHSLMIHFKTNSFELSSETIAAIDKWVAEVWSGGYSLNKSISSDMLSVLGHCDRSGEEKYNKRLSELRAASLAKYLFEKHGIKVIEIVGLSRKRPISRKYDDNRYAQIAINEQADVRFKNVKMQILRGPLVTGR